MLSNKLKMGFERQPYFDRNPLSVIIRIGDCVFVSLACTVCQFPSPGENIS